MRIHTPVILLVGIVALCMSALLLACGGQEPLGSTPAAGASEEMGGQVAKTKLASVTAGGAHTCGLRVDSSVACWGRDDAGQATTPEGEFTSFSAGFDHTCGLRADGSVGCWVGDDFGEATPLEGCESPGSIDRKTARSPGSLIHFCRRSATLSA